jgi:hypothetical protein
MEPSECFTDNKAVYISIPLDTEEDCHGLLEPLKRNKHSFAIISTVKGYVVIREPVSDDKPVMVNEFTNRMQIVRYWRRGEEVKMGRIYHVYTTL